MANFNILDEIIKEIENHGYTKPKIIGSDPTFSDFEACLTTDSSILYFIRIKTYQKEKDCLLIGYELNSLNEEYAKQNGEIIKVGFVKVDGDNNHPPTKIESFDDLIDFSEYLKINT